MSERRESQQPTNERFRELDRPYEIQAERSDGERVISAIAADAEREYVWAFDSDKSLWIHHPSEAEGSIDLEDGHSRHSAVIPKELMRPPGTNSDIYHIHPEVLVTDLVKNAKPGWHTKEFLQVSNQIPKAEDLTAASVLINNGYKAFKVITTLGVSTVKFFPENLDKSKTKHDIQGMSIDREFMYKALEEGLTSAIEKVFARLNDYYKGVFVYEYEPFVKEE